MKKWLWCSLFFLSPSLAHAEDACAIPKSAYDATYCESKLFYESDKELNEVYQGLRKELSAAQKQKLLLAQRKWLKFRENACASFGMINVKCNFKVNRDRAEVLRDRLRECKTGHCREDLLIAEDWSSPSGF